MATNTLSAEDAARAQLRAALEELHFELGRCPALEELDLFDLEVAAEAAQRTNEALSRAERLTKELALLDTISEEAIVLLGVSRNGFVAVRALLAGLVASIDMRGAA